MSVRAGRASRSRRHALETPVPATVDLPEGLVSLPTAAHRRLWDGLMAAHGRAVRDNPNSSRETVAVAFQGSGSMTQAIAAGMLVTGLRHAPLEAARALLGFPADLLERKAAVGDFIPGFGNSFFPSGDPAFLPLLDRLRDDFPDWYQLVLQMRAAMERGLPALKTAVGGHEPNAALYTALVCELCQVPRGAEIVVFLLPRLGVWALRALEIPA